VTWHEVYRFFTVSLPILKFWSLLLGGGARSLFPGNQDASQGKRFQSFFGSCVARRSEFQVMREA